MKKSPPKPQFSVRGILFISSILVLLTSQVNADVKLESQIKITDKGLYFDGEKLTASNAYNKLDVGPQQYDYVYGPAINPHGDCIKSL